MGLPADTTPESLLVKLGGIMAAPDPAKYMPMAAVQEMLRDRRSERAQTDARRAVEKVEQAVKEHYITPGMKDWALALCQSDEAAFDTFCQSSGPVFSYLFKQNVNARLLPAQTTAATALEAAIYEQLGLKPGSLKD